MTDEHRDSEEAYEEVADEGHQEQEGPETVTEQAAEVSEDSQEDQEERTSAADAALGAARGAGKTLADGFSAMRNVHHASREHSTARTRLKAMQDADDADRDTLDHRDEIAAGYDDIVAAQEVAK